MLNSHQDNRAESPVVSVIIPVYNAEEYLGQCVKSVLDQELSSLEVILVDDGSEDSSVAIIERFQTSDSRVRLIKQNHEGAGEARNKGLSVASGTYIQFLDSDDWASPAMLKDMVRNAEKNKSDIVVSQAYEFDDETGREWLVTWVCKHYLLPNGVFCWKDIPSCIFTAFPALVWNKLFRREFIERENIAFQGIPRSNDVCFMGTAAVAARRISVQKGAYVHHRVSNPNSCQATKDFYPQGFVEARVALKAELLKRGVYESDDTQQGVKSDFLNQALDTSINMLTKFKTLQAFNAACDALVPYPQGPSSLGFEGLEADDYRNQLNYQLYQVIANFTGEERLFRWGQLVYQAYRRADEHVRQSASSLFSRACRKAKREMCKTIKSFRKGH